MVVVEFKGDGTLNEVSKGTLKRQRALGTIVVSRTTFVAMVELRNLGAFRTWIEDTDQIEAERDELRSKP